MKVLGIIAEYNPFHNGHLYHLKQSLSITDADCTVAVMSGNFTQRGEPAFWDKWQRAEMAVRCGIDLVLELPVVYACNNAEYFAKGGIGILNGLGCVTHLSFGSESGELTELVNIASHLVIEEPEFKAHLKIFLNQGLSYAAARQKALGMLIGVKSSAPISESNNILAVEYLKQLNLTKSDIIPVTVKRRGASYREKHLNPEFSSATSIRQALVEQASIEEVIRHVPKTVAEFLKQNMPGIEKKEEFYRQIISRILTMEREELAEIFSATEGVENRLKLKVRSSSNYEDLLELIGTKRYADTRLQRLFFHTLLHLTKEKFYEIEEDGMLYGRVLAFNEKGSKLIRSIKKEKNRKIPVITNINREEGENLKLKGILNYDIIASDLYNLIAQRNLYTNSDFVKQPYRLKL